MRSPIYYILFCVLIGLNLFGGSQGQGIIITHGTPAPGDLEQCYKIDADGRKSIPCADMTTSEPQVNWLGWPVTASGNALPLGTHFGMHPQYELGLRDDGVVVWRKVEQAP